MLCHFAILVSWANQPSTHGRVVLATYRDTAAPSLQQGHGRCPSIHLGQSPACGCSKDWMQPNKNSSQSRNLWKSRPADPCPLPCKPTFLQQLFSFSSVQISFPLFTPNLVTITTFYWVSCVLPQDARHPTHPLKSTDSVRRKDAQHHVVPSSIVPLQCKLLKIGSTSLCAKHYSHQWCCGNNTMAVQCYLVEGTVRDYHIGNLLMIQGLGSCQLIWHRC